MSSSECKSNDTNDTSLTNDKMLSLYKLFTKCIKNDIIIQGVVVLVELDANEMGGIRSCLCESN